MNSILLSMCLRIISTEDWLLHDAVSSSSVKWPSAVDRTLQTNYRLITVWGWDEARSLFARNTDNKKRWRWDQTWMCFSGTLTTLNADVGITPEGVFQEHWQQKMLTLWSSLKAVCPEHWQQITLTLGSSLTVFFRNTDNNNNNNNNNNNYKRSNLKHTRWRCDQAWRLFARNTDNNEKRRHLDQTSVWQGH